MTWCTVQNCSSATDKGFKLRRFPSDPETRALWLRALNLTVATDTKNKYVCELHFSPSDYMPCLSGPKLRGNAVPTLFCTCPKPAPLLKEVSNTTNNNNDHSYGGSQTVRNPGGDHCYSRHADKENLSSSQRRRGRRPVPADHIDSCPLSKKARHDNSPPTAHHVPSVGSAPHVPDSPSSVDRLPSVNSSQHVADSPTSVDQPTTVHAAPLVADAPENPSLLSEVELPTAGTSSDAFKSVDLLREENVKMSQQLEKVLKERNTWRSECFRLRTRNRRLEKRIAAIEQGVSKCLNKDQLRALSNKSGRVKKYSTSTIQKSMDFQLLMSSSGYRVVRKKYYPLASERTCLRKIQHVKFSPGIQEEVIESAPQNPEIQSDEDLDCVICFDDMSIQPALQKDPATNTMIGYCTIPGRKPAATKELIEEFGGDMERLEAYREDCYRGALRRKATKARIVGVAGFRRRRWKMIVAYYFVGDTSDPTFMADQIKLIVQKLFITCKLRVRLIVCDMGNRDVYRVLGISSSGPIIRNYIPHPCDNSVKVYCTYDIVHVHKNIKHMLVNNKVIYLPWNIVEKEGLPSNCVKLEHLITLVDYQEKLSWKPAPFLKRRDLGTKHFNKMKVAPAKHFFSRITAAALEYLSKLPQGEPAMKTTAYFLRLVDRWNVTCTARHASVAPGTFNPDKFQETMKHLDCTVQVFGSIQVGQKGDWKPSQTGVIHCTTTLKDLVQEFVVEKGDKFLLSANLTQDFIENENSQVRQKHPTPTPLLFKGILRKLSFTSLRVHVKSSSYDFDGCAQPALRLPGDDENCVSENPTLRLPDVNDVNLSFDPEELSQYFSDDIVAPLGRQQGNAVLEEEKPYFYRVCGYVVFKFLNESKLQCNTCVPRLKRGANEPPHRYSEFLLLTNYTENAQTEVSNEVFELLLAAEERFVLYQNELKVLKEDIHAYLWEKMFDITRIENFPICHDLPSRLVKRFIRMRTWMLAEKPSDVKDTMSTNSQRASKSMFSRVLVDQV